MGVEERRDKRHSEGRREGGWEGGRNGGGRKEGGDCGKAVRSENCWRDKGKEERDRK